MQIELKKIQIAAFASEETLCFNADVYVDGKKAGYAKNDGRGGCTFVQAYPETRELMAQAEAYAKSLPPTTYPAEHGMKAFSVPMDLENLVDDLVGKYEQEKENAKFAKRLAKDCLKGICYGTDTGYRMVSWPNKTIAEVLADNRYRLAVIKAIAEIKDKLKDGEKILNTNLPYSF